MTCRQRQLDLEKAENLKEADIDMGSKEGVRHTATETDIGLESGN